MILQPIGDNIVLELPMEEKKEEVTKSGIIIPKTAISDTQARDDVATVIAVGEGRRLNNGELLPLRVQEGDRVLFNKYAGTQLIVSDRKFLMLKENDILAIVK